jgi:hypothetical protein
VLKLAIGVVPGRTVLNAFPECTRPGCHLLAFQRASRRAPALVVGLLLNALGAPLCGSSPVDAY